LKNSLKELKIKGKFVLKEKNKNLQFNISESNLSSSNKTDPYDNFDSAESKSEESLYEASLCFNQISYKIGCDIACKYLTDNFKKKLKNKKQVDDMEKLIHSGQGGANKKPNKSNKGSKSK
jgi:hypothetical protein